MSISSSAGQSVSIRVSHQPKVISNVCLLQWLHREAGGS